MELNSSLSLSAFSRSLALFKREERNDDDEEEEEEEEQQNAEEWWRKNVDMNMNM